MAEIRIPFNRPHLTGSELSNIADAVASGKISGNGKYTQACQALLERRYGFGKTLLTSSCTDALEMAALLLDLKPGDEVIVPSYTFVSTANAFVLRGAKLVFADSGKLNPNLDAEHVAALITPATKAIVIVHYAGVACDMGRLLEISNATGVPIVEDAAQAIDATYRGQPLGTFGCLAAFSFHETKNIIAGEGGMLAINRPELERRAEIIWEKGTNRAEFFRGEVNKYGWVDLGSSFLPSEVTAAFLFAQLEQIDRIQAKRHLIYERYLGCLTPVSIEFGLFELPHIPSESSNNAHMFYLVCRDQETRGGLINYLRARGILAVFHYLSLHTSEFARAQPDYVEIHLSEADRYTDCLVRLPLFFDLAFSEVDEICGEIAAFCIKNS